MAQTADRVLAGLDAIMEGRMDDPLAREILDSNIEQRIEKQRKGPGMADKLTREQIDYVLDNMTGADIVDHIGDGSLGAKVATGAFDSAAARLGVSNGTRAMELLSIKDFMYMASQFQEVVNLDSPKPELPDASQDSVSTGE